MVNVMTQSSPTLAPAKENPLRSVKLPMSPKQPLGDTSIDYAKEVGLLTKSAQSPVAIGSAVGVGGLTTYLVYRLRNGVGAKNPRYALAIVSGIFATALTHGMVSWHTYKKNSSLADAFTDLEQSRKSLMEQRSAAMTHYENEIMRQQAERLVNMSKPIPIAVGIASGITAGYYIYKWRNPPGSTKQRWVLAVFGGIVASSIGNGLTAAMLPSPVASMTSQTSSASTSQAMSDDMREMLSENMSDILNFSSITSSVVSVAVLMALVGGGLTFYDRVAKPVIKKTKKR